MMAWMRCALSRGRREEDSGTDELRSGIDQAAKKNAPSLQK